MPLSSVWTELWSRDRVVKGSRDLDELATTSVISAEGKFGNMSL